MEIKVGGHSPQLVVVIGEIKYPLRKPKVKEARHFESQVKLAKEGNISYFDIAAEFLASLGLPKEVYEELETGDVESILTKLNAGEEKKS